MVGDFADFLRKLLNVWYRRRMSVFRLGLPPHHLPNSGGPDSRGRSVVQSPVQRADQVGHVTTRENVRRGPKKPFAFFRAGIADPGTALPVLEFERVTKFFKSDEPTLRDINLKLERGEFLFVTGPSGSGKSTLLQLIYRKTTPDEGRILFMGKDIARLSADSVPFLRRNLGIVFQDFKVIPNWTVFENVAVALELLSMPQRLIRSRVAVALERVGLAGRGDDTTAHLSGGEQQRVAVARAIVAEPPLLLADEPTGNLDPHLALDILTLLEEINSTGTTVVFATHDHTLLAQRPHRIVYLDEGEVKEARKGLRDLKRQSSEAGHEARRVSGFAPARDEFVPNDPSLQALDDEQDEWIASAAMGESRRIAGEPVRGHQSPGASTEPTKPSRVIRFGGAAKSPTSPRAR